MTEAETQAFTVEEGGKRLDKLIASRLPDLSRTQVQQLIADGNVTVDGAHTKAGIKLRGGETIQITIPVDEETELIAEDIPRRRTETRERGASGTAQTIGFHPQRP